MERRIPTGGLVLVIDRQSLAFLSRITLRPKPQSPGNLGIRLTEDYRYVRDTSAVSARVYVVEDSPIIVALLSDLIHDTGGLVIGHADASSVAIAEIAHLQPDVVTIDIELRRGTGFDVLRALANGHEKPPMRIVLSNLPTEENQREAKALGAEYFLDKTRQIRDLLRILEPNSTH